MEDECQQDGHSHLSFDPLFHRALKVADNVSDTSRRLLSEFCSHSPRIDKYTRQSEDKNPNRSIDNNKLNDPQAVGFKFPQITLAFTAMLTSFPIILSSFTTL